ncbi:hypothetical protein BDY21DRAFT_326600 [Lineolata rhizophorae]|uniref:NAD-dependent epimerase/dehydratase domain-containing protein n=1 Tax=Lineolata rhizophorae TaxID=578093 RepID=A0A6A6NQH3_9PEZI|nr:hypothetical protein BDY21DRAFT_326600 [Lineolata rhizophorae]
MTAASKKLVVCGGTGFLGSRICRAGASRGWDVTSLSRSGNPNWSAITSSSTAPSWSIKVDWAKGDMMDPNSYSHHLTGATAVIHSMGILLEADYKGVVQGRESPISGLRRAFSANKKGAATNPLDKDVGQGFPRLRPGEPDAQLTYELMNRDTALALALASSKARVKTFGYVSAVGGAPILPHRYITTKREAEALIAERFPDMRAVFFRPPFLYDNSRAFTLPMAAGAGVAAGINGLLGGIFTSIGGAAVAKPLKADVVADAVVEALEEEGVKGPVEPAEIERLAEKAWRRGML